LLRITLRELFNAIYRAHYSVLTIRMQFQSTLIQLESSLVQFLLVGTQLESSVVQLLLVRITLAELSN